MVDLIFCPETTHTWQELKGRMFELPFFFAAQHLFPLLDPCEMWVVVEPTKINIYANHRA